MKKILAVVLCCLMVLSMCVPAFAQGITVEQLDETADKDALKGFKSEAFQKNNTYRYADDEIVRVIVLLNGAPAVQSGAKDSAAAARQSAKNRMQQTETIKKMNSKRISYHVVYTYDTLLNGMSMDVAYGDLDTIAATPGVKAVYIANTYTAPDDTTGTYTSDDNLLNAVQYDGAYGKGEGTVVAVIDTGLYTEHELFSTNADIEACAVLSEADLSKTTTQGKYLSAKVPFSYDYADQDDDVTDHDGHGSHVAGIATGYAADNPDAAMHGVAPMAQLLAMKVFHDAGGGTSSDIYFAALEDAYLLGADVINMSLGTDCGFTYDSELETEVFGNIYEKLQDAGIFVSISAGNAGTQGSYSMNTYTALTGAGSVTADYTDYGTVGTPSTYNGVTSVASVNSTSYRASGLSIGDGIYPFQDNDTGFIEAFENNAYDIVMIPGVGTTDDFAGIDCTGKLAVVQRGEINFSEKMANAAAAGAVGMICCNHAEGGEEMLGMTIETPQIPGIFMPYSAYAALDAAKDEPLTITIGYQIVENANGGKISDFSSYGTTSDMAFKPQITGVGGNVISTGITAPDAYTAMSGTSMASPCVAGCYAVLLSYYRTQYAEKSDTELYELITDCIEGSASMISTASGYLVTPRAQGAGLINISAAANDDVVIGNPLVVLGDDAEKTGSYTFDITVTNNTDATIYLDALTPSLVVDSVVDMTEYELGYYNTTGSIPAGISALAYDESFKVATGASGTLTVSFVLDQATMSYLDTVFENGGYVDGFAFLSFVNAGSEPVGAETLHASMIGFYGDWEKAPVLEANDYTDAIDALYYLNTTSDTGAEPDEEGNYPMLADSYSIYDVLEMNVGFNEAYLICDNPNRMQYGQTIAFLGDNLFDYAPVNTDHNAISNPTGTAGSDYYAGGFEIYPSLLRNAEHLIMTVSNSETDEVYYVDDTMYARKNTFNPETAVFEQNTYFAWQGTDADGEYLENGTKVDVTFTANLDYGDKTVKEIWNIPLTIDNEAPVISDVAVEGDNLAFTVSDNEYLSYVSVYSALDGTLLYYDIFADEEAGTSHEITIPLDELDTDKIIIDCNDYATNFKDETYSIRGLGGETWDCPFVDVDLKSWYAANVEYAYEAGLFVGIDETHFAPDAVVSRAQMARVLFNLSGFSALSDEDFAALVETYEYENTYIDVQDGAWYKKAVDWASMFGIVSGDGSGKFMPNDPVTREQMALMLMKYDAIFNSGEGNNAVRADLSEYADAADISLWAEDALSWAVANKLLLGTGDNKISPSISATRAQLCAIVQRYQTSANNIK